MTIDLRASLLAATAIGIVWATPAAAQQPAPPQPTPPAQQPQAESDQANAGNDIVVTARRVTERLQDVPISITVLTPEKLQNNNIQSAKDIATYTPGLTTNNRYGADNTTWTIRGFTQEQRTTATVGTYFADVVAPRGSGATQGGDGAGPGSLFDLQSVQVLKGPQGTLFGRNSTGGAVLLVPRKPTDRFEGYVEGSVGNYDMRRLQAVVNVPVADWLRVRFGMDRSLRDGYEKNRGNLGFGPNGHGNDGDAGGSIDYWALRFSAVADITPDLENYLIATYSKSESTGLIPKITRCFLSNPYTVPPASTAASSGAFACAQMAREAELGFWSVSNPLPDSASDTKQWQVINTTTWRATDWLTVKNIFSYAKFWGDTNLDLFGLYRPVVAPDTETNGNQVQPFNTTHALPGHHTNAQSSLVEELQFQGRHMDGRLFWQGGLYLEVNNPIGLSGIQSTTQTPCADVATFNCNFAPGTPPGASIGRLAYQTHKNYFRGKAAYFQASYDITDQLKFTAGIRYTKDTVRSDFQLVAIRLNTAPFLGVPAGQNAFCLNDVTFGAAGSATNPFRNISERFNMCKEHHKVSTSAPTWLLGLDYKPIDNVLLYAKWSRGYRQGGVAPFAADKLQDYDKEKVDTYEIGAKTSWRGSFPGYFNISAFYNDFSDQQLQFGLSCNPVSACAQTTAIINAASSTLKGFEAEAGITPFTGLRLEASYAYLKTKVKEILDIQSLITGLGLPFTDLRPLPLGSVIPNAQPHKLILSATYTLPFSESLGKISVGGTWVYGSKYRAVADPFLLIPGTVNPIKPFQYASKFGILPSTKVLNLNFNWENVGGKPIDWSIFVTNVTNEHILLHSNVQAAQGFVSNIIGEPRMWGTRLRVKWGR
jgi:iron complex outermembrane receptor protein